MSVPGSLLAVLQRERVPSYHTTPTCIESIHSDSIPNSLTLNEPVLFSLSASVSVGYVIFEGNRIDMYAWFQSVAILLKLRYFSSDFIELFSCVSSIFQIGTGLLSSTIF